MTTLFGWLLSFAQAVFYQRRLATIAMMLLSLLAFGTIGYMVTESWSVRDALFMTVITLSTVGYNEVHTLGLWGEIFTIVLIILGVGGAAYTFSAFTNYIVAGELQGVLRERRMLREINLMHDHYIICGYGRVGRQVVEGLRENNCEIVVIDHDEALAPELEREGISHIIGSSANDELLIEAGIKRARGLSSCLPTDADNVFVVLSARVLNPDLKIIARSNSLESAHKLRIAGADQIMNPYLITGRRMAAEMVTPAIVEFLDVVMQRGELELRIEEINVGPGSMLDGRTLGQCNVRGNTGVNVLAVQHPDKSINTNLDPNFILYADDSLICLGTPDQLAALSEIAKAP